MDKDLPPIPPLFSKEGSYDTPPTPTIPLRSETRPPPLPPKKKLSFSGSFHSSVRSDDYKSLDPGVCGSFIMDHRTSTPSSSNSLNDPSSSRKRLYLLRELYTSEKQYYNDITLAIKLYQQGLNSSRFKGFVTKHDRLILFSNLEEIQQLSLRLIKNIHRHCPSQILQKELSIDGNEETLVLKDINSRIGLALLDISGDVEKLYQVYCSNNDVQMETYYRLAQFAPPRLALLLHNCSEYSQAYSQAWTLDALLIKPVQRLLKYPLLLKRLLAATDLSHPDYYTIQQALSQYEMAAERINGVKSTRAKSFLTVPNLPTPPSSPAVSVLRSPALSVFDETDLKEPPPLPYFCASSGQPSPTSASFERRNIEQPELTSDELFTQNLLRDPIFIFHLESFYKHGHYIKDLFKLINIEIRKFEDVIVSSSNMTLAYRELLGKPETKPTSHMAKQKLTQQVLAPLQQVLQIYDVVRGKIKNRDILQGYYLRYLSHEWAIRPPIKLNTTNSLAVPPNLEPTTLNRTQELADKYVKLTVSLKEELPQLFQLTEQVSTKVITAYFHLKQDWIKSYCSSLF